jgi:tetratricopeptide (TPR) repeat protein
MAELHELYSIASKLKDQNQNEEAINKLVEILEIDESFVLAHLALSVVYGRVGRHQEAVQHGQRACESDPRDAFNFTALSVTCQRASQAVDNAADNQRYVQAAEEAMAQAHQLQGGM